MSPKFKVDCNDGLIISAAITFVLSALMALYRFYVIEKIKPAMSQSKWYSKIDYNQFFFLTKQ